MRYPRISLDDAVVVVTGGARGIGRSTADLFAEAGATVCVGDIDGGDSSVDVTSRDSFTDFIASALDRHGRIDVLVNNAGVMPLGDFLSEDDAVSRTTFDVNVWGLIYGMRLVLPHMIERGRGHIVNVASMAGKLVIPGMAVYNASKFAAVGLSAAVREEYRDSGVSVTTVLPSAVRTRLASGVPLGHRDRRRCGRTTTVRHRYAAAESDRYSLGHHGLTTTTAKHRDGASNEQGSRDDGSLARLAHCAGRCSTADVGRTSIVSPSTVASPSTTRLKPFECSPGGNTIDTCGRASALRHARPPPASKRSTSPNTCGLRASRWVRSVVRDREQVAESPLPDLVHQPFDRDRDAHATTVRHRRSGLAARTRAPT